MAALGAWPAKPRISSSVCCWASCICRIIWRPMLANCCSGASPLPALSCNCSGAAAGAASTLAVLRNGISSAISWSWATFTLHSPGSSSPKAAAYASGSRFANSSAVGGNSATQCAGAPALLANDRQHRLKSKTVACSCCAERGFTPW